MGINFLISRRRFLILTTAVLSRVFGLGKVQAQGGTLRFAVIGDYGQEGVNNGNVSTMVRSWNPEFIITVGDNNYLFGEPTTIDANVGQYYHDFMSPYNGIYGPGAATKKFFPSIGNHDYYAPSSRRYGPYLDYFTLPGNGRYYDFVRGPVHFFAINSDANEFDGITSTSVQGQWLQNALAGSSSPWKIVYFHHAPYTSGQHGNATALQWPFAAWGASVILTGHEHDYERLTVGGLPYFVNGTGGHSLRSFLATQPGSQFRYSANYGAQLVTVTDTSMTLDFYSVAGGGTLIDTLTLQGSAPDAAPQVNAYSTSSPLLTWSQVTWATGYRVQVDNDLSFASPVYDNQSLSASDLEVTTSALSNGTYYWRVAARRANGTWGNWSDVESFTIAV